MKRLSSAGPFDAARGPSVSRTRSICSGRRERMGSSIWMCLAPAARRGGAPPARGVAGSERPPQEVDLVGSAGEDGLVDLDVTRARGLEGGDLLGEGLREVEGE